MDDKKTPEHETIRLLFELDRVDDPQLYDDLIRFKKGTKRINRLRLLAREGVIAQLSLNGAAAWRMGQQVNPSVSALAGDRPVDFAIASDVFAEPIAGQ
jgi:hypothetical protein